MKRSIIVLVGILLVTSAFAQPGARRGQRGNCGQKMIMHKMDYQENRAEMLAFKLTEQLELTTKQADQFFPRFREHRAEVQAIREDIKEVQEDIRKKVKDGDKISDAELDAMLKKINTLTAKKDEARWQFINGLDDILDNTQIAKLTLKPEKFDRKNANKRGHRSYNRS